jgi:hypothetical protein
MTCRENRRARGGGGLGPPPADRGTQRGVHRQDRRRRRRPAHPVDHDPRADPDRAVVGRLVGRRTAPLHRGVRRHARGNGPGRRGPAGRRPGSRGPGGGRGPGGRSAAPAPVAGPCGRAGRRQGHRRGQPRHRARPGHRQGRRRARAGIPGDALRPAVREAGGPSTWTTLARQAGRVAVSDRLALRFTAVALPPGIQRLRVEVALRLPKLTEDAPKLTIA